MGASQLAVFKSVDTVIDESPVIAQKKCVGAYAPAQASVYADTGYTAMRAQAVHEPGDVPIAFEILQAVAEFPTAAAADKLLVDQTAQWAACSGTDFTLTYSGMAPQGWKFGPLITRPTVISDETCSQPTRITSPLRADASARWLSATMWSPTCGRAVWA